MTEQFTDFDSYGFEEFTFEGSDESPEPPVATTGGATFGAADHGLPNGAGMVVVDADPAVRDYLAAQLGHGVDTMPSLADLESRFGPSPLVVVLGPSCIDPTDLAVVERWSRTHLQVGTVLIVSELSTTLLQTALRAGVKDVLTAPIDQVQLIDTVTRVAEGLVVVSAPATAPGSSAPTLMEGHDGEPGTVISVFSTKGGSGKSVMATNMGAALARMSDRPVILVDGHLQFGDCAVMLKLQPQHTVVDAISQIDRLDAGLLHDLLTVHEPSGLLVLAAPTEPTFADQITGEQMVALIELFRSMAGHVLIDMPAYFNDVVLSLIDTSDHVLLVAGLDIPNIKNVKIGLTTLRQLGVPTEKLQLVLNRSDSKVKLDVGEVEKTLQIQAAARVPSDVVVPISVNRGSPVVLSEPRSDVARAIEQLALRFIDGEAVAHQEKSSGRRRFFGG